MIHDARDVNEYAFGLGSGFKVATPLLERAFRDTYGLDMKDLFLSEDLAVGTFRHAVAATIPNVTKVAWERNTTRSSKRRRALSARGLC